MNERSIFLEALEKRNAAERGAYLDTACGADPAVRQRIDQLLAAHAAAGGILDRPALPEETAEQGRTTLEDPGTLVGPYKLVEQIGEGGMGTVWMAQQLEPIRRLVAIKLIKPGMDSKQVLARFEAERQALALMDHPNIAKVFDAGTTGESEPRTSASEPRTSVSGPLQPLTDVRGSAGRPYFVMELVKGVPITRYCDEHHLTPRQRLELFIPVCQAIQHAHQKGIIHRDIKPSNVLVALYDDRPVPKVIDFGVAKAAGQDLTEATLHTNFGAVVGTLEYMSPEQASFNQLDVDTRSDIYSLGVLLYELLTGSPPFTKMELESAGVMEMLRVIREKEPSKPSTKLSTAAGLPALAANRGTEPKRLTALVRGELDWIVMKALEKDRNRRYETANGFAMDVQRYLADEPVLACPPSAGYRLRKVLRKYRRPLITGTAFLLLLLIGGAALGWQAVRLARADRDQAIQQAKRGQDVQAALGQALALRTQAQLNGNSNLWAEARAMAKRAEGLLEGGPVEPVLTEQVRALVRELDAEEKDRRMLETLEAIRLRQAQVKDGSFDVAAAGPLYAEAFQQYGIDVAALPVAEAAARIRQSAMRDELLAALDQWMRPKVAKDASLQALLRLVADSADDNAWRRTLRHAVENKDKKRLKELSEDPAALHQSPAVLKVLAEALRTVELLDEAVAFMRKALERYPGDFWLNHEMGYTLYKMRPSRARDSLSYYRASAALRPASPGVFVNLGIALRDNGDRSGAIVCQRKAIELDPNYAEAHSNLGKYLIEAGQLDEGIAHCRKAIEIKPKLQNAQTHLARGLEVQGKWQEAIAVCRQAIEADDKHAPAYSTLGALLITHKKDYKEAAACLRKAIEIDPTWPNHHDVLGVALAAQGQIDEAMQCWRKAIGIDSSDAVAYFHIGDTLAKRGNLDGALPLLQTAIELDPGMESAHFSLGLLLQDRKDLTGAVKCYRKVLELEPEHIGALNNLGNVLVDLGHTKEANTCWRMALELNPRLAEAWLNIGQQLAMQRRIDEAIDCFRKSIELDPKFAKGHFNLGISLGNKGKWDEAILAFKEVIGIDPGDFGAYARLGDIYGTRQMFAEAAAMYRKALEIDPKSGVICNNLGNCLDELGMSDEAFAAYDRAVELAPNDKGVRSNLNLSLHEQSIAAMKRVAQRNPNSAADHYNVAAAAHFLGNLNLAIAAYRKTIELDPKHTAAQFNLGHALLAQKKPDQAIDCWKKVIDIDPKHTGARVNLGNSLQEQKKLDEAIACFHKAIEADPNSVLAHYNLGNAYRDQKNVAGAIECYRKTIALNAGHADAHTYLAWWLATASDPKLRDPVAAVAHARRAVQLHPQAINHWSNLGIALLRDGNAKGAALALEKAERMKKGEDHYHRFFLAMAYWQIGEKDKARQNYERAVQWMEMNPQWNDEQRRFRVEAEELLMIDDKSKKADTR